MCARLVVALIAVLAWCVSFLLHFFPPPSAQSTMPQYMFIWDPATGRASPLTVCLGSYTLEQSVGSRRSRTVPKFDLSDPRADAYSWTVQQVAVWLRSIKMPEQVVEAFVREDIDGPALSRLGAADELKILLPKMGDRLRFEHHQHELDEFARDADRHRKSVAEGEYQFHFDDANVKVK